MKHEWIWLDMDGTIADLYGVDGWLEDLMALRERPYREAKALYDTVELLETLSDLKDKGYKIGIISWLAKKPTAEYNERVIKAKRDWLKAQYLDILLDEIIITAYGVKKANTCRSYGSGILIDDEEQNRNDWDLGKTIDATENILEKLRGLL
jgi:hypothetical protein